MKFTKLCFTVERWIRSRALGMVALVAGLSLAVPTHALMVTPNTDANNLVNALIQPGITLVDAPTFTGDPEQGGIFADGTASGLGVIDEGVILSSGDVQDADGPNTNGPEDLGDFSPSDDDANSSLGGAGDADLDDIVGTTNDAAALEFTFQFGDGSGGGDLFFNYIFASEEYLDFVDTDFNDVFALFVDDSNVAVLPDGAGPVTINNVNPNSNSAFYVNNVPNAGGRFPVAGADVKYDGFTTVLQAQALGLGPGAHSVKFAVADTSDDELDSAVLIQAGTLGQTKTPTTPTTSVPEPSILALIGIGLAALGFKRRTD